MRPIHRGPFLFPASLDDLVVDAEFRDAIFPGLISKGGEYRGGISHASALLSKGTTSPY